MTSQAIGKLKLTKRALNQLIEDGYDPANGARPLRRAVQTYILNPLANAMIGHGEDAGGTFNVDYRDKEYQYDFKAKKSKKKATQNRSNQLIDSAAQAYLKNPKLLPRH